MESSGLSQLESSISPNSIKIMGESIGITNLDGSVTKLISDDISYRISILLQDAEKFSRHEKRNYVSTKDFSKALMHKNMEPFYGFTDPEFIPFKHAYANNKEFFFNEEFDLDLTQIALAQLPKIPLDSSLKAHWLCIEGIQPIISENIVPSGPQKKPLKVHEHTHKPIRSTPKRKFEDKNQPLHTSNDPCVAAYQEEDELSMEQHLYYRDITEACVGSEEIKRAQAFQSLASDPGLHQLLPRFTAFISDGVKINVVQRNLAVLIYLMRMVRALLENPYLNDLELYLHEMIPAVLSCALSKQICQRPEVDNHWALRDFAAKLLAQMCRTFASATNMIQSRITALMSQVVDRFIPPTQPPSTIVPTANSMHYHDSGNTISDPSLTTPQSNSSGAHIPTTTPSPTFPFIGTVPLHPPQGGPKPEDPLGSVYIDPNSSSPHTQHPNRSSTTAIESSAIPSSSTLYGAISSLGELGTAVTRTLLGPRAKALADVLKKRLEASTAAAGAPGLRPMIGANLSRPQLIIAERVAIEHVKLILARACAAIYRSNPNVPPSSTASMVTMEELKEEFGPYLAPLIYTQLKKVKPPNPPNQTVYREYGSVTAVPSSVTSHPQQQNPYLNPQYMAHQRFPSQHYPSGSSTTSHNRAPPYSPSPSLNQNPTATSYNSHHPSLAHPINTQRLGMAHNRLILGQGHNVQPPITAGIVHVSNTTTNNNNNPKISAGGNYSPYPPPLNQYQSSIPYRMQHQSSQRQPNHSAFGTNNNPTNHGSAVCAASGPVTTSWTSPNSQLIYNRMNLIQTRAASPLLLNAARTHGPPTSTHALNTHTAPHNGGTVRLADHRGSRESVSGAALPHEDEDVGDGGEDDCVVLTQRSSSPSNTILRPTPSHYSPQQQLSYFQQPGQPTAFNNGDHLLSSSSTNHHHHPGSTPTPRYTYPSSNSQHPTPHVAQESPEDALLAQKLQNYTHKYLPNFGATSTNLR